MLTLAITAPPALSIEAAVSDDSYNISTTVQGAQPTMVIKGSTGQRAYMRFTIMGKQSPSSPPAQSDHGPVRYDTTSDQIARATLRVFASAVGTPPVTLQLFKLTSSWEELTLKMGVLPQPYPTPVTALITGTPDATVQVTSGDDYVYFDVTTLVRAWVDGTANYGVVIQASTTSAASVTLDAKENVTNAHPAVLQIVVEPATVPKRGDVSMGIFITP